MTITCRVIILQSFVLCSNWITTGLDNFLYLLNNILLPQKSEKTYTKKYGKHPNSTYENSKSAAILDLYLAHLSNKLISEGKWFSSLTYLLPQYFPSPKKGINRINKNFKLHYRYWERGGSQWPSEVRVRWAISRWFESTSLLAGVSTTLGGKETTLLAYILVAVDPERRLRINHDSEAPAHTLCSV